MAVKIIEVGKKPEEEYYLHICSNCGTKFSFSRRDASFVTDFRNGDYLVINCPVCNKRCSHNTY